LEVSSEDAGYSAEQTAKTYKTLYGVLADDQTAVTTTANLQALGLSQEKLNELTNATIGGWAKYGDSIPIDGLAEAINETAKVGKVTGTFANVLNWAGVSEDEFNTKLESIGDAAGRADLILQQLTNQGLAEAGEAWQKNNQALVENNLANAEMQEQLALLGETIMPVITQVTEIVAGALEKFNSLDEGTQKFILSAIALVAILGPVLSSIGSISSGISSMSGLMGALTGSTLPSLSGAFSSVFSFIAANPVVLLIAAIVGLVALIATKGDEIQVILQKVDDFLQNVFATDWEEMFGPILGGYLNAFFQNVENIWNAVKQIFNGVIDFIRGVFTGDWERAWDGVKQILSGTWEYMLASAKAPLNGIIGLLNIAINAINEMISGFNGIGFDMPSWLGGGSWHPSIPHIPNIPGLYQGGTVVDGGTVLVGERGPEFLDLPAGARVRPLDYNGNTLSKNDVYEAAKQAVDEIVVRVLVEADESGVFKSVQASNEIWKDCHGGESAFV